MQTTKYHCDMCDKEIMGSVNVYRITITRLTVYERETSESWELCVKCRKGVVKYLKGKGK